MMPNTESPAANSRLGPLLIDLDGLALTSQEQELLADPLVGGVILFSRNYSSPQQLQNLVADVRRVRSDLLLCVDQEGGRVQRFKAGFTCLPALGHIPALSKTSGVDLHRLVRMHASVMASELLAVGIDFSFAPVVDINYGHNEVIADRSFGSESGLITELSSLYVNELKQWGMAATAKHFPGHGYVSEDTHVATAVDTRSKQQILSVDGEPFRALIAQGVAGIMPAHVIYPAVDELPAVQSRRWIEEVLRGELGFTGAVIGDDLGMAGAAGESGVEYKTTKAIAAGCDLVMVCNNRQHLLLALKQLHEMDTDHLADYRCARRCLLSRRPALDHCSDFTLDEARQVLATSLL